MSVARLVPDEPLPPYSYVPGLFPHPFSDAAGHGFFRDCTSPEVSDPARWRECRLHLLGIDLFNFGYYWEAHHVWEALWDAAGREGPTAEFFKALIQLAVAGVKLREGRSDGAHFHATRAAELFQDVCAITALPIWFGLDLRQASDDARTAQGLVALAQDRVVQPLEIVFPFRLTLARDGTHSRQ